MAYPCPACRNTTVSAYGMICARCRANGVEPPKTTGVDAATIEQDIDPYDLLQKMANVLNADVDRLVAFLAQENTEEARERLSSERDRLAKACADIGKQMSQFKKLGLDAAKKMTREQKRALVVPFFKTLPPEEQRALLQELTGAYNAKGRAA